MLQSTSKDLSGSTRSIWMVRTVGVIMLLLAFGLGLITGVGGTTSYFERQKEKLFNDPEGSIQEQIAYFKRRVGLNEEQAKKAESVFRQRHSIVFNQIVATSEVISRELQLLEDELEQVVDEDQIDDVHSFFSDVRNRALPFKQVIPKD
jgi:hypothetical protein